MTLYRSEAVLEAAAYASESGALKAHGCSHARALRTIGDRLLYVACTMLKNHTLFDPCLESQKCA